MQLTTNKPIDTAVLTADDLLRIPAGEPERLFAPDRTAVERLWRRLAAAWHPDRNPDIRATALFRHVTALRQAALQRLDAGTWHAPGCLTLASHEGRTWRLRYLRRRAFELGDLYAGRSVAAFVVDYAHADLADAGLRTIASFRFADAAMRAAVLRYLPAVEQVLELPAGRAVILRKPPDMILLADLVAHLGGRLDARHVAWILSELHCFACWLAWAGLTHNAIAPDTVLVSPAHHAVAVTGGWWYAAPVGARLAALPARSMALAAPDIIRRKTADPRLDLDLIRALGRELLGDATARVHVPGALASWLGEPSAGSAQADYRRWQQVLRDSFGPRRFVPLSVRPQDVYG